MGIYGGEERRGFGMGGIMGTPKQERSNEQLTRKLEE
jgi:hypothetical protein